MNTKYIYSADKIKQNKKTKTDERREKITSVKEGFRHITFDSIFFFVFKFVYNNCRFLSSPLPILLVENNQFENLNYKTE